MEHDQDAKRGEFRHIAYHRCMVECVVTVTLLWRSRRHTENAATCTRQLVSWAHSHRYMWHLLPFAGCYTVGRHCCVASCLGRTRRVGVKLTYLLRKREEKKYGLIWRLCGRKNRRKREMESPRVCHALALLVNCTRPGQKHPGNTRLSVSPIYSNFPCLST